jgi:hypothetical protein
MTKTVTRMMATAAALGLIAAPIMAQANTRAADSAASYSTSNALPGLGRAAAGEGQVEEGAGFSAILIGGLAAAAIITGIVLATDEDQNDDASPGT